MAVNSQLTALCAVASFLWLSHSVEGHRLIEQPRLSSLLILLISGIVSFLASFFSFWLPGANGRFDDDLGSSKAPNQVPTNLPKKPRRYFLPVLVGCIVLRLELFHRVSFDLQCSAPGVEVFLPLVFLVYELQPGRRARLEPEVPENKDDFEETNYDHVGKLLTKSTTMLSIGVFFVAIGAYFAFSFGLQSTYFCSIFDSSSLILRLQWIGLVLDGAVVILIWRVLAWSRTTKGRLKTLSGILLASAFLIGVLYVVLRLSRHSRPIRSHFRGLDSLYFFDMAVDGFVFSIFFITSSLLICEGTPLTLSTTVIFLSALLATGRQLWLTGTWENVSPGRTYFAGFFLFIGFSIFLYANTIRSVLGIPRPLLVSVLSILWVAVTIYMMVSAWNSVEGHPIETLIYQTRVEEEGWLRHASTSGNLKTAVQVYKERHNGRDPPPKFDAWFKFAMEKKSPIIDRFNQIDRDIMPFWGLSPGEIRQGVDRMAAEPDVCIVQVREGVASYEFQGNSSHRVVLDDLVDMMKGFSDQLPDLDFAVNLDERPRILAPWTDMNRLSIAGARNGLSKSKLSQRSESLEDLSTSQSGQRPDDAMELETRTENLTFPEETSSTPLHEPNVGPRNFTSVRAFREMTALTCPPWAAARAGVHWDVRDFCYSCVKPQSQGHFLVYWERSLDLCHQPDLIRLHGFHMTPPEHRPQQELLPIFSRSKTDSYSDILIPLRRAHETHDGEGSVFDMTQKKLYWRGKVDAWVFSHELLRGGHQERLVHLANNASAADKTTVILSHPDRENAFHFEQAPTREIDHALPLNFGISDYSVCSGPSTAVNFTNTFRGCAAAYAEFGVKPDAGQPLNNRYVLAMDSDSGPSGLVLNVVRSGSVPFIASIFREWYTERLLPWAHFVPIDLRFHALHSTLAYFTGLRNGGRVNGRDPWMAPMEDDARWIAEHGRSWADTALRREDMQVYLFRLLLEWARLTDDNREESGFVLS